jgi:hypothetical protein
MKYALLVYADDTRSGQLSEEEKTRLRQEVMPRWEAAIGELAKADPDLKGFELDGRGAAKVVRVREGERIVTDGPFAETKEIIGGLFLIDLPDLDEAIRLAAIVPAAEYGSLEIRPILE